MYLNLFVIPEWLTLFNAILIAIVALSTVAVAILFFLSKRKDGILETEKQRADSNAGLVTTRDNRIKDLEKELEEKEKEIAKKDARIEVLEEEVESVTSEYRTVVGIDIDKIFAYWQTRDFELAKIINLTAELRILKQAKGLGENDDVIHKTNS